MSALLPRSRHPLGGPASDIAFCSRISQATSSSYVTANSNGTGDISSHGIRSSVEAWPTSSNDIPGSISSWHCHNEEPSTLPRIAASPADSLTEIVPHVEGPLKNDASSQGKVSHDHRKRPPGKGFCVLCFDGGGCRGYISLLVLRHLLRQLEPDETKKMFPYLYFDLICGTSTGGLITVLLAVLHLDLDTAIEIYEALIIEVFAGGFSVIRYFLKDAGYSRKPLKRAIAKILEGYAKERDGKKVTQMEDPIHNRGCRGIVTTAHCVGEGRTVIALRSYTYPGGAKIPHLHNWTWVEAALATTAAPGFFKHHSITKLKHRFRFEDAGAHRTNNPTKFALEECQKLDDAEPQLHAKEGSLFISLGTGTRRGASDPEAACFLGFLQTKRAMASASAKHATDVNDVHELMEAAAAGTNSSISYHRLNPPLSRKIAMGDWEELPAMENSVFCYCDKNSPEFKECADALELFQTPERRRPQNRPPPASSLL